MKINHPYGWEFLFLGGSARADYQKSLRLCRSGLGNNPIAKAVGCKWDTVERTLTKCEECWGTIKDVPTDLRYRNDLDLD